VARILVADDDVDIRELVEFKLSTLGHEIVAVSDGAAAIDACKAQRPDLAVLDVMMPGVSGLDGQQALELLLERLKKSQTNVEFLMQVQKTTPTASGGRED